MSITHQLITPDGTTFDLDGSGTGWGHGVSPGIPGGVGLPPLRHVTQEVYGQPGATLRGIDVRPRIVDLPLAAWGDDVEHLMEARAALWGHLRYNRDAGDPPAPAKYRVTVDGTAADLKCYYAGDITRAVAGTDKMQLVGIRLMAFDPLWYETTENELRLDHSDTLAVKYIAGKVDGQWSALGPPSAVGGAPSIRVIAVHPTTGDVYVGGTFINWDGDANADYIVYWDVSASAWVALSAGLNGSVYDMAFGPDGTLYVAGNFTNAGGDANADYFCQWNDTAFSAVGGVATSGNAAVRDMALAPNGDIYVVGLFTNWATIAAADYAAMWDASAGAWVAVGVPTAAGAGEVHAVIIGPNGTVFIGGNFLNFAGDADADYIAQWDGSAWGEVGGPANGIVWDLLVATDGSLYACGDFTTIDGLSANRIARWNGASWAALGTGLDASAYHLAESSKGTVYTVGSFTQAGGLALANRAAKWNGYTWAHLDLTLPGSPSLYAITLDGDDIYLGFSTTGDALVAGVTTTTNDGSADSYPILKVVNVGTLRTIVNETTGEELLFDLYVNEGETITLDLSPGVKTVESDWRGDLLHKVLPNSDLNTFHLASAPVAGSGQNEVSCFITGADPRETGDNNNQLSGWEGITGLTLANTDGGRLYVTIARTNGVTYQTWLYGDAAKTLRVGYTKDYTGAGTETVYEDNSSGLGGTIEIDAVVGTDADIEVLYTLALIYWHDRWTSLDEAVT